MQTGLLSFYASLPWDAPGWPALSTEWIATGAFAAAALLIPGYLALRRRRRCKAIEAMKERPWSAAARALLAEPLNLSFGNEESGPDQASPAPEAGSIPDAAPPLSDAIRWLLDAVAEGEGTASNTAAVDELESAPTVAADLELSSRAGARQALESLLYELPLLTGGAEVEETLQEVATATLRYYRYALTDDAGDLPVSLAAGTGASLGDSVTVAGYLELERRLGRVPAELSPTRTASTLVGAMAARALGLDRTAEIPDEAFARRAIQILLFRPPAEEAPPRARAQINGFDAPAAGAPPAADGSVPADRISEQAGPAPAQTAGGYRNAGTGPLRWRSARNRF